MGKYHVVCNHCEAASSYADNEDEAAILWNTQIEPETDDYIQLFVEWLCEIIANSDETQTEIIDIIDRIRDGQLKVYIETKQRLKGER